MVAILGDHDSLDDSIDLFVGAGFAPGTVLHEAYTGQVVTVSATQTVGLDQPGPLALLEVHR